MSFLNRHRTLMLIAAILLLLLLIGFLARELSLARQVKIEKIAKSIDTIIQFKTVTGKTAYKVYEKSVVDSQMVDSLARELRIKQKEIERYITIVSESNYSGIKTVERDTVYIGPDSIHIPGSYIEFRNHYIDLAASITDSVRFYRLLTLDTLSGVFQHTVIGGQSFNKFIATHSSPYSRIVGLEDIKVAEEPKYRRWALGAHAGWNPFTRQPDFSIGINYDVLRFKK